MNTNMKVLVTGANGYLGQGVVKAILDMGNEVIATDFATQNVDNRACKVDCNLFNVEDPFTYFGRPDVLLHMAWRDGFIHYSDAHIADLPKHAELIQKFARSEIKTIAVMGSMHEVGFYEGSIDEYTACHPQNFYGVAKNTLREITEIVCKQNEKNFQWLRGYYIVGNSKFGSSIFSKITAAVEDGKETFPFTMGLNQFDFIDYDEFCVRVAATIIQSNINGIINICTGRPEKLADRVERFIKDQGYNIKLNYGEFKDRPYDSKAVWGNDYKIAMIMRNQEKLNR